MRKLLLSGFIVSGLLLCSAQAACQVQVMEGGWSTAYSASGAADLTGNLKLSWSDCGAGLQLSGFNGQPYQGQTSLESVLTLPNRAETLAVVLSNLPVGGRFEGASGTLTLTLSAVAGQWSAPSLSFMSTLEFIFDTLSPD